MNGDKSPGRTELASRIENWMALNDPTQPGKLFTTTAEVTAALGAMAAPSAGTEAVVSNAQLTGGEAAAVLAGSTELKQMISEKDYEKGLRRFKEQPMDGCTSVMNIARLAAGFNPLDPDVKGNVERFKDYAGRILSAPFFNLGYSDSKHVTRKSKDWNDLINSIVGLFEGVKDEDRNKIKDGLEDLAKAATSSSKTKQKMNLFLQNVLQADGGTYRAFLYYSSVELEEDKSKGSTSRQTDFTLARAQLVFRSGDWPFFAERVWKKQVCVVDDWLDGNTTLGGEEPVQLCFGS
jgi:hypothetical protein